MKFKMRHTKITVGCEIYKTNENRKRRLRYKTIEVTQEIVFLPKFFKKIFLKFFQKYIFQSICLPKLEIPIIFQDLKIHRSFVELFDWSKTLYNISKVQKYTYLKDT